MSSLVRPFTRIRNVARISGSIAVVVISVMLAGVAPASAQDTSPEASPSVASTCNVDLATADADQVYTIDAASSSASYVVMEELQGVGANEVTGTTTAILGSVLLDENSVPLACSNFAVDMRTMETDESKRDNYLRENVLESETYPYATFLVSEVTGLEGGLVEGETAQIQLVGDLTIHNVTKTVTWEAEVTLAEGAITGTATTTITIEEWDMEKPIIGPVVSIDDEVTLNISVSAPLDEAA